MLGIIAIALGQSLFSSDRLTNLDLSHTDFRNTYIMFSKTNPGRCYVVNRRQSTMRRSDATMPGRMQDCFAFGGDGGTGDPGYWFVRSKRKGTVLFVPVAKVSDWTYPFLYDFVRGEFENLDLPPVEWSQVFVNRVYQGLYLELHLPFDKRKKDGGSGIRREILTVTGEQMTRVDTRFDASSQLYPSLVAAGTFPKLSEPRAALAWLTSHRLGHDTTVLLHNVAPHDVSLLPLPVPLAEVYRAMHGHPLDSLYDERFGRWEKWRQNVAPMEFLDHKQRTTLMSEFSKYSEAFLAALTTHSWYRQEGKTLFEQLPRKQAAVADLKLSIGAP